MIRITENRMIQLYEAIYLDKGYDKPHYLRSDVVTTGNGFYVKFMRVAFIFSYNTLVGMVNLDTDEMRWTYYHDYSRTTSAHISKCLNELRYGMMYVDERRKSYELTTEKAVVEVVEEWLLDA